MRNKSFILLKPDAIENKKISNSILNEITTLDLQVTEEYSIILRNRDIVELWNFCARDLTIYKLLQYYLANRTLRLIFVEGEEAITKINTLKRKIRFKFATSAFANCFHAPKNEVEYVRDSAYLLDLLQEKYKERIMEPSDFPRYRLLTIDELQKCADELYYMQNERVNTDIPTSYKHEKYMLFMLDDNIHELGFVAAAIYEFFQQFSIIKCYECCIIANNFGRALLISSNNLEVIKNAQSFFDSYDIITEFEMNF
jgi:nucleoside diphosphate kinase